MPGHYLVLVLALHAACTRPRDGLITAGAGLGIAVGGTAAGGAIDRGELAPDDGFALAIASLGVGGGMIAIGLVSALVLYAKDRVRVEGRSPRPYGWRHAAELGEQAVIAADLGDCQRAKQLAELARDADSDYYDQVLIPNAAVAACLSR